MTPDEAAILLAETAAKLGEHFAAVQINVSWGDEGTWHSLGRGCGNPYARVAMAREFIKQWDAQTSATEIADAIQRRED